MKLKRNSFKTVSFQPKQPWNVLAVLAIYKPVSAVYDKLLSITVNQTLVNKHGDHMRY